MVVQAFGVACGFRIRPDRKNAGQPGGDARQGGDEKGRHGHGDDGGGQKVLIVLPREQGVTQPHSGQHERKFSYLAQAQAAQNGHMGRIPQYLPGQGSQCGFQKQQHQCQSQHIPDVMQHEKRVQQHADGDEKHAGEYVPERQHSFQSRVAVFGIAHDQPGQKRSQRQGQPGGGGQQGNGEAKPQGRHEEQFPAAGTDHGLQHHRHQLACPDKNSQPHQCALQKHFSQMQPGIAVRSGQKRHQKHHGHYGHILKNEHAQRDAAVRGGELGFFPQHLEHDGRTGQSRQKPAEHGRTRRHPRKIHESGRGQNGQQDLRSAAQKNRLLQAGQFFQGQFHADGEKQQDHSHFRENIDLMHGTNQPQTVRAGQNARQQKADDGRHAQAMTGHNDRAGQAENGHHVFQKGNVHNLPAVSNPPLRQPVYTYAGRVFAPYFRLFRESTRFSGLCPSKHRVMKMDHVWIQAL